MFDKMAKMGKKKMMSPNEKSAKMNVLKDIRGVASDELKNRLSGLKKVSVMSNSQPGMAEGLEKAQELMGHSEGGEVEDAENPQHDIEMAEENNDSEEENEESPEEEASEDSDEIQGMSDEDVKAKLRELMALHKGK